MRILLLISCLMSIFVIQAQTDKHLLYKAYERKSTALLDEFFRRWQAQIQPITDSEFQAFNDTLKNTYAAYSEFLKWKTVDSSRYSYELIQNSIAINFTKKVYFTAKEIDSIIVWNILADDSLDRSSKERCLIKINGSFSPLVEELYSPNYQVLTKPEFSMVERNFRPVSTNPDRILYMDSGYENLLYEFLHRGKDIARKDFLDMYLRIQKEPFTGKWEFVPYSIGSITFDEKMAYVRIDYGIGERIYMKRENEKWKFVSHELLFLR